MCGWWRKIVSRKWEWYERRRVTSRSIKSVVKVDDQQFIWIPFLWRGNLVLRELKFIVFSVEMHVILSDPHNFFFKSFYVFKIFRLSIEFEFVTFFLEDYGIIDLFDGGTNSFLINQFNVIWFFFLICLGVFLKFSIAIEFFA